MTLRNWNHNRSRIQVTEHQVTGVRQVHQLLGTRTPLFRNDSMMHNRSIARMTRNRNIDRMMRNRILALAMAATHRDTQLPFRLAHVETATVRTAVPIEAARCRELMDAVIRAQQGLLPPTNMLQHTTAGGTTMMCSQWK
jgi:hypothetical protein